MIAFLGAVNTSRSVTFAFEYLYAKLDKNLFSKLFQLIAARYEKRLTIITTNQAFSKWPEVFGDAVLANAIIDRIVHHCEILKITGHSYRIKDRRILEADVGE